MATPIEQQATTQLIVEIARMLGEFSPGFDRTTLDDFMKDYDELMADYEAADATQAERDATKRQLDALAKGLPALAGGLRDAIKGFQSDDPCAGSAGIMDLCATITSTIGAMVGGAAGPPGAVVGALFSVVSMILKMFSPPQESLSVKLENMIRELHGEDEIGKLKTAQKSLRSFITTVGTSRLSWTYDEYLKMLDMIDGNTINAVRGAAEWLENPKNQNVDLWGEALAAQVQAYSLIKHGLTCAVASLDDTAPNKVIQLAKLTTIWTSNDRDQLAFLQRIKGAARRRGATWHVGTRDRRGDFPDSGTLYARDKWDQSWKDLAGDHRIAAISAVKVTAADPQKPDPKPFLAVFGLEQQINAGIATRAVPGAAYRNRRNAGTYGLFGRWPLGASSGWIRIENLEGCHDVYATPGEKEPQVLVYAAKGGQIDVYLHGGAPKPGSGLTLTHLAERTYSMPAGYTADIVRVVQRPDSLASDRMHVDDVATVVYGSCSNGRERLIAVRFLDDKNVVIGQGRVRPHQDMLGMSVDRHYVWIFTRSNIQCASHGSIRNAVATDETPIWANYVLPPDLYTNWQTEGRWTGLHDLAACDDGTLTAVIADKSEPRIYSATPVVTWTEKRKTIEISGTTTNNFAQQVATNGWAKANGEAWRVYKQPLFGWNLLIELERVLQEAQASLLVAPAGV
jgi:hypothetical protein